MGLIPGQIALRESPGDNNNIADLRWHCDAADQGQGVLAMCL